MKNEVLCIGAAHIDRTAQCISKPTFGESNPISSHIHVGGVACNIARNLRLLDHNIGILTSIGDDDFGLNVKNHLIEQQINTDLLSTFSNKTTASYTAVSGPNGSLILGLEDMQIYKQMDAYFFMKRMDEIKKWPNWLVDANVPTDGLQVLAQHKPKDTKLFASMVSPAKARSFENILPHITALFGNRSEISALFNRQFESADEIISAAQNLHAKGVEYIFITLGKDGVAVCNKGKCSVYAPFPTQSIHDNGAGDAFASATIHAFIQDKSINECTLQGLAAASLTLEAPHSAIGTMSQAKLNQKIAYYRQSQNNASA